MKQKKSYWPVKIFFLLFITLALSSCGGGGADGSDSGSAGTTDPGNQPPSSTSILINGGAPATSTTAVTLALAANDLTDIQMYITNNSDCTSGGSWENYNSTKDWTLSQTNGEATVYVKFKDAFDKETSCISDTIIHDNDPPTSTSISINGGETTTNSTSVTLTLAATDLTDIQMYITNTEGCSSDGTWENFSAAKEWILGPTDGTVTVYVKFKDNNEVESDCISASIMKYILPPDPTGLSATADSSTQITLSWTSGGVNTQGFQIAYSEGDSAPDNCSSGTYEDIGNVVSKIVTGLDELTQYSFRVCAYNSNPTLDYSLGVEATQTTKQDDPLSQYAWHLNNTGQTNFAMYSGVPGVDLNLDGVTQTGEGIKVAVSDTGVETSHEDLTANVKIDLSRNYSLADSSIWHKKDSTPPTDLLAPHYGHGTAVAGIIGAAAYNGLGSKGVAPSVEIGGFRFLAADISDYALYTAASLDQATGDFDIFNYSYGISYPAIIVQADVNYIDTLKIEVETGRAGKGPIYVKSAGNSYEDLVPNEYTRGNPIDATYCTESHSTCCKNIDATDCPDGATSCTSSRIKIDGAQCDFNLMSCPATELNCQINVVSNNNEYIYTEYDGIYSLKNVYGNSNFDGEQSYPYYIIAGALNASGQKSSYSSPGSSIWISAPGGEYGVSNPAIMTTDLEGCNRGFSQTTDDPRNAFEYNHSENSNCNYTSIMNGTSSAAPMTSGVVALMLSARPELTWRDVKHILATTAVKVDEGVNPVSHPGANEDGCVQGTNACDLANHDYEQGWVTNRAGYNFHNWYGFGAIDASAAVAMAVSYNLTTLGETSEFSMDSGALDSPVPDVFAGGVTSIIAATIAAVVETVQVEVSVEHTRAADLGLELTSPHGTKSILMNINSGIDNRSLVDSMSGKGFKFLSNAFYGESIKNGDNGNNGNNGNWTLKVIDGATGETGTLRNWKIKFFGH